MNFHCILKCIISHPGAAHQVINVAKTGLADGGAFRSYSTKVDDADLKTDPVGTYVNQTKPFNTAVHEVGHDLGFTHACEAATPATPATPYCLATDPRVVHVWTAPLGQGSFGSNCKSRVRSCLRPVGAG